MNSFNVYGQTSETIGGNTPVWLGTVKPVPRGGRIAARPGLSVPAGTLVSYKVALSGDLLVEVKGLDSIEEANGYVYNDVIVGSGEYEKIDATCAVVMHHPEGLLIERVYPEITEEQIKQLQAKIPGVLLVRG